MTPKHMRFSEEGLRGVELHFLYWGDRRFDDESQTPIVFLHGGGANAHWWDHIAPLWADRHSVVALDFRGHGDSDHPTARKPGAFNEDLEALLRHLGRDDVILVGHSMGAHVALDHASRRHRTRAAVLIDPARGGGARSRRRARLALAFKRSYATRDDAIERYRFLPPSEHASESLRSAIAAESVRREPDGRFGFKFDPRWFSLPSREPPDTTAVKCPTLIVRGMESAILSADGARSLCDELPLGQSVEIEAAGHHVLLDAPDALVACVSSFLTASDIDVPLQSSDLVT